MYYYEEGDMKKAKFHNEIAAMAGHEEARYNLGVMEGKMLNLPRAKKHLTIAASAGSYLAMHALVTLFEPGVDNRADIDSILLAYNKSCAETRSEARDNSIRAITNKYALPNSA
jgi:TPR repeat protein